MLTTHIPPLNARIKELVIEPLVNAPVLLTTKELLARELFAPTTATMPEYASQNISSLPRRVEYTVPHGMQISTLDACVIWADEDLTALYVISLTFLLLIIFFLFPF